MGESEATKSGMKVSREKTGEILEDYRIARLSREM
jgi:hypothetical protein